MQWLTIVVSEDSGALIRHCASLVSQSGKCVLFPEDRQHPRRHIDGVTAALASGAERIVVGTHSEAVVNGVCELVAANRLNARGVEVHIVGSSNVRVATCWSDGTLDNWPIGFFAP